MDMSCAAMCLGIMMAFVFVPSCVIAVSMDSCPLVAEEIIEKVVTCDGIDTGGTVVWYRSKGNVNTLAGQCDPPPGGCSSNLPTIMELSRPSADVSKMTIKSATRSLFGGATIRCTTLSGTTDTGSDSCQMDVIYAANVTSCSISPVKSYVPWSLRGTCSISKAYSSMGRYVCQLRQQAQGALEESIVAESYNPTMTGDYVEGTCSYSAPMPTESATYTFRAIVTPGNTSTDVGTLVVAEPVGLPNMTCRHSGLKYIPENTDLNCTCSASDLGQPQGRIHAYRGNTRLALGNYGDGVLNLPTQTLGRHENGTAFRCALEWASAHMEDTTDSSYIANVTCEQNLS